jgi:hypothetical protein
LFQQFLFQQLLFQLFPSSNFHVSADVLAGGDITSFQNPISNAPLSTFHSENLPGPVSQPAQPRDETGSRLPTI